MRFIYFFNNVGSQVNFSSYYFIFDRVWVVKSFCSNVKLFLALFETYGSIHEVAISNRPDSTKLHVVNLVMHIRLLSLMKKLDFFKHWVDFGEGLFFSEELHYGIDIEIANFNSFSCYSSINLHFVKRTRLISILDPLLWGFELLETLDYFLSCGFELFF